MPTQQSPGPAPRRKRGNPNWNPAPLFTAKSGPKGAKVRALAAAGRFSEQQVSVAEAILEGRSNEEIATALGVTVETVKAHVKVLLRKTDLPNRTALAMALVTYLQREGDFPSDPRTLVIDPVLDPERLPADDPALADILRLVVFGKTDNEIAQALGLPPNFVKTTMRKAVARFDAANRTELALILCGFDPTPRADLTTAARAMLVALDAGEAAKIETAKVFLRDALAAA